jgi:hypothetical protein
MRFNKKSIIAGVAVLAAAGGGILVSSSADAATAPQSSSITTASTTVGGKGSVTGWHIKDGTLEVADLSKTARDALKGDRGKSEDPATDAFGKQGGSLTIDPKVIATIGGSWVVGKTYLGSFTLPAGTWLINSAITFDRKDANDPSYLFPTTDTMPQFALRYNITGTNIFGDDAGTLMGIPISRAGYTELTGSSTRTITLTRRTTITAYGFGYNEDRSGFGGGQITVGGQVTAVRIH